MTIYIPALIVADHTAASAFADVNLVNGRSGGDPLPFCDKLFDHYPLNRGVNVGGAGIGADLTGYVDPSGIGTGDHKGEKKQAESCRESKRNAGKEERPATPFHFPIIDRFLAKHRTTSLKSEG